MSDEVAARNQKAIVEPKRYEFFSTARMIRLELDRVVRCKIHCSSNQKCQEFKRAFTVIAIVVSLTQQIVGRVPISTATKNLKGKPALLDGLLARRASSR